MNKLNILCLVTLAVGVGCLGYTNTKLQERVSILESESYYNSVITNDTSMKLEMFLQAMSDQFEDEVKAVVRPMLKEQLEDIKVEIEKWNTSTEQD
tara:strand:- start:1014 stop:1301 length:288 start_codon:yes stop_codon:yes gene_type:complete